MKLQKLLCFVLMCFGFSLVYAAAQTQPAAGPPSSAPATPPPPGETGTTAAAPTTAPSTPAPLPDPKTPQEFFDRAGQLSDLEASGIPFHLKATYVASGDTEFTGNGTYEEWWQSKDLWRKEATLGDYKYVEIQYGGKNAVYGSSDYIPLRLRQMLDAVLIRIAPDTGTASEWKQKKEKLKNVDFVVLSSINACTENYPQVKCVTQDHFTQSGVLRIHAVDVDETLYDNFHLFEGMACPASVYLSASGKVILAISLTFLEKLNPNDPVLSKDAQFHENLQPVTSPKHNESSPGVVPPKLIHPRPYVDPNPYPRLVTGTVVVNMIIDAKGNVREPYVVHSGGPSLDKSIIAASRSWKFAPLRINGVPYCSELQVCAGCTDKTKRPSENAKKSWW